MFLLKVRIIGKDAVTLIVSSDRSTYISNDAVLHKLTKELDILKNENEDIKKDNEYFEIILVDFNSDDIDVKLLETNENNLKEYNDLKISNKYSLTFESSELGKTNKIALVEDSGADFDTDKYFDDVLNNWTTTITAGDILRFDVISVNNIRRLLISLKLKL